LKRCGHPFNQAEALLSAMYFHKFVMPQLAGATEQEKFATVFRDAPLWLLWFTLADVTMEALEIAPRDRAAICRFRRSYYNFAVSPVRKYPNVGR
jgi:hypothetical protein